MPILDPSLQYFLITECKTSTWLRIDSFYLRYLRIASRNIYRNFSTIETSIHFKNNLKKTRELIKNVFKSNSNDRKLDIPTTTDYYATLLDIVTSNNTFVSDISKRVDGDYFIIDKYGIKFFKPSIIFPEHHSWFFSDTPIAILSINIKEQNFNSDIFPLIQIEIDLMRAAGFTLVLCANYYQKAKDYFFQFIKDNQFSEIHINFLEKLSRIDFEQFLKDSNDRKHSHFQNYQGYIYFYSLFLDKSSESRQIYKHLKKYPRIYFILFSKSISRSIKSIVSRSTRPFSYCKCGFQYKKIRVILSNIPIYNYAKDNYDANELCSSFVPSQTSDLSIAYLSASHFLNWSEKRVKIIFEDQKKVGYYHRYLNFDDLHKISKEVYVTDPLSLSKIDQKSIEKVDKIENTIKIIQKSNLERTTDLNILYESIRKFISKLSKDQISQCFVAYYLISDQMNKEFNIRRSQIYSVMEACNILIVQKHRKIRKSSDLYDLYRMKKNAESFLNFKLEPVYNKKNMLTKKQKRFLELIMECDINKAVDQIINMTNEFVVERGHQTKGNFDLSMLVTNKKTINEKVEKLLKEINDNIIRATTNGCNKGVIYQVDTGEGKSHIIAIIAAILVLQGKTVHIASSNIDLANRDYQKSFHYFNIFGKSHKSAVLCHDNELPFDPKNLDKTNKVFNTYYNTKDFDLFYSEERFKNSSRMNYLVCGLDDENPAEFSEQRAKIVFSTFVNFECFYLKLMEAFPGFIDQYFSKCVLLVDEADSILIDEITNGTIISREMKSNLKKVLPFVYDQRMKKKGEKETLEKIIKKYPMYKDLLTEKDISRMYSDIDIVTDPEFKNNVNYVIEERTVKNKKRYQRLKKMAIGLTTKILKRVGKGLFTLVKDTVENGEVPENDDDDDDDDDDDNDEEEESIDENGSDLKFNFIVPYDSDHKGILERNKEFDGFIQQFIAIKESKNGVPNMVIKDLSMSYLYISHPIFVKLYSKVAGFTGTIGNHEDKKTFIDQYNLTTLKVPRNSPNQRVDFPMILCKDTTERNEKIVKEVLEFHKRGNPVLVIFQDPSEIKDVQDLLTKAKIEEIHIFDGKNHNKNPETFAGIESAISLGTNVCGRGTHIEPEGKPLHVIISYYTSNTRVLFQAFGRTARQGTKGTARIICVKYQYLYPKLMQCGGIQTVIQEYSIKNQAQTEYIEYFNETKSWIFASNYEKQKFETDQIIALRSSRINMSRIKAYNYEFPLKMSYSLFLKIQAQKIFSIYNCPNTKYTWQLFQRYIREMILESWSLMINKLDDEFYQSEENIELKDALDKLEKEANQMSPHDYKNAMEQLNEKFSKNLSEYRSKVFEEKIKLLEEIKIYIPFEKSSMVDTFMHIFNFVNTTYNSVIYKNFNTMPNINLQFNSCRFMSCLFGLRPYSLLTKSGARVTHENFKKISYIEDPELKYLKKVPDNKPCFLSITTKIDDLFDLIAQKINAILGEKLFVKLFLRRTLCGAEIGICLNFKVENNIEDEFCILDKDPLIMFTINVRSMAPFLAGVLIFALVYLGILAAKMALCFPKEIIEKMAKKGLGILLNTVLSTIAQSAIAKVIDFFNEILHKQIEDLKEKIKIRKKEKATKTDDTNGKNKDKNKKKSKDKRKSKDKGKNKDEDKNKDKDEDKKEEKDNLETAMDIIKYIMLISESATADLGAEKASKKIRQKLNKELKDHIGNIKFSTNFKSLLDQCLSVDTYKSLIQLSVTLLLCLITFILNFSHRHDALKDASKDANEYTNAVNDRDNPEKDKGKISSSKDNKPFDQKVNDLLKNREESVKEECGDVNKGEDGKGMNKFDAGLQIALDIPKYSENNYTGFKKAFINQVHLFNENHFATILKFFGYIVTGKYQTLYLKETEKGTLESTLQKEVLSNTSKMIIAYGVARAMKHLHDNKIIHRNLNTAAIVIDGRYYPYLSDLYYAKKETENLPYVVKETRKEFMAPEFLRDFQNNQNSYAVDVYSYGILLFMIVTQKKPFPKKKFSAKDVINGERPKLPGHTEEHWKELITQCWSGDPAARPNFTQICEKLEADSVKLKYISEDDYSKFTELKKFIDEYKDEPDSSSKK